MGKARKRQDHDEAHANHERWLVSYADMMTLLMVLFIVMFAISQVDQRRFMQLRDGMAAGFGAQPSPFQGDRSVLSESGSAPMAPVRPGVNGDTPNQVSLGNGPMDDQLDSQVAITAAQLDELAKLQAKEQTAEDALKAAAVEEVARLDALRRSLEKALKRQGLLDDVKFKIDERGLRVSLVSRHIVFEANLARLADRGKRVLRIMAPVIKGLPNQIEVAGHTNQVAVKPKYYATDWELSAARAVTVLRYLNEQGGVPTENMLAAAYGHEQPLIDPRKKGSQAINKRVDIVVLSTAADAVRRLFGEVIRDGRSA